MGMPDKHYMAPNIYFYDEGKGLCLCDFPISDISETNYVTDTIYLASYYMHQ